MSTNRPVLYLDTCAIIEAHRVGCWRQMVTRYEMHTVAECRDELRSGNARDSEYIAVDVDQLERDMVIHVLSVGQRIAAGVKSASFGVLDAGERDLLAWCAAQAQTAIIITTGDRAAIVAACELGLRDNLKPLEEIVAAIGVQAALKKHYCRVWLAEICTKCALDNI